MQEHEAQRIANMSPIEIFLETAWMRAKQLFWYAIMIQMVFGINCFSIVIGIFQYFFMSDSNLNRFDFNLTKNNDYRSSMSTTNIKAQYWVTEKTRDNI